MSLANLVPGAGAVALLSLALLQATLWGRTIHTIIRRRLPPSILELPPWLSVPRYTTRVLSAVGIATARRHRIAVTAGACLVIVCASGFLTFRLDPEAAYDGDDAAARQMVHQHRQPDNAVCRS